MAAILGPFPVAASPAPRPWPAGMVPLARQLQCAADGQVRRRMGELQRQRPQGLELLHALHPLVIATLAPAAAAWAGACEVGLAELLHFALPLNETAELAGVRCRIRRLDRVWGGSPIHCVEALRTATLAWTGPQGGHCLILRGPAQQAGAELGSGESVQLAIGGGVELGPGAIAAFKSFPVATLLEAAQAAGFDAAKLAGEVSGREARVTVASGALALQGTVAILNGRSVRLTRVESALMQALAARRGQPVARPDLAAAAGLRGPRGLDKLMAGLRDKLGDGVIATVYGTGYALELQP